MVSCCWHMYLAPGQCGFVIGQDSLRCCHNFLLITIQLWALLIKVLLERLQMFVNVLISSVFQCLPRKFFCHVVVSSCICKVGNVPGHICCICHKFGSGGLVTVFVHECCSKASFVWSAVVLSCPSECKTLYLGWLIRFFSTCIVQYCCAWC